jgi:hypothetical protein
MSFRSASVDAGKGLRTFPVAVAVAELRWRVQPARALSARGEFAQQNGLAGATQPDQGPSWRTAAAPLVEAIIARHGPKAVLRRQAMPA